MSEGAKVPELPSILDSLPAPGDRDRPIPRKRVIAWALWDWATQPFNSVIITFVFTALYLTKDDFLEPAIAALSGDDPLKKAALADLAGGLGAGATIAGLVVAVLAPVLGQRADARGRRKAWLGVTTGLLIASMFGLFFVQGSREYFWWGVALIAFGTVVSEIAGVNYNAMLTQVSRPSTVGKVSGLGWGLGYVGGIVALVIVIVADSFDYWGLDTSNGMVFRLIAVGCAVWAIVFGWALFVFVPEAPRRHDRPAVGFFQGYKILHLDLRDLWRNSRATLWFLMASAVYRDGLAGVFAYGAIIAAQSFAFGDTDVMVFGVAANLIAGVSTILAGRWDDKVGPRAVILAALGTITVAGIVIVAAHTSGSMIFWIFGLVLSACVGPAQAASRSLLARLSPAGQEAQVFGLFATTGRAASFLSPALWTACIAVGGATIWGTLGVIAVVAAGLLLMIFVRTPADKGAASRG